VFFLFRTLRISFLNANNENEQFVVIQSRKRRTNPRRQQITNVVFFGVNWLNIDSVLLFSLHWTSDGSGGEVTKFCGGSFTFSSLTESEGYHLSVS
jgi:hypothetical protein